jgi:hypothetical protein
MAVLSYVALWVPHISSNVIIFFLLLSLKYAPTCGFLVVMLFTHQKFVRDVIMKNGKVLSSYRTRRVQEGFRRAHGTRCREVIPDLCYDMATIVPIPFYRVEAVEGEVFDFSLWQVYAGSFDGRTRMHTVVTTGGVDNVGLS